MKVILQRSTQDEAPNVFQDEEVQPEVRNEVADRSEASASLEAFVGDGAPVLVRRPIGVLDARISGREPCNQEPRIAWHCRPSATRRRHGIRSNAAMQLQEGRVQLGDREQPHYEVTLPIVALGGVEKLGAQTYASRKKT